MTVFTWDSGNIVHSTITESDGTCFDSHYENGEQVYSIQRNPDGSRFVITLKYDGEYNLGEYYDANGELQSSSLFKYEIDEESNTSTSTTKYSDGRIYVVVEDLDSGMIVKTSNTFYDGTIVEQYCENGEVSKRVQIESDGRRSVTTYNYNGYYEYHEYFDADGNYTHYTYAKEEIDEETNTVIRNYSDSSGNIYAVYTYDRDSMTLIKESIAWGQSWVDGYYENGERTHQIQTNSDGSRIVTTYQYDGEYELEEWFNPNGELTDSYLVKSEYDEENNKTIHTKVYEDGSVRIHTHDELTGEDTFEWIYPEAAMLEQAPEAEEAEPENGIAPENADEISPADTELSADESETVSEESGTSVTETETAEDPVITEKVEIPVEQ